MPRPTPHETRAEALRFLYLAGFSSGRLHFLGAISTGHPVSHMFK
ncbi:MAG: hypothetical protein V4675_09940 [Verrucomicrobiota bacterium]